MELSKLIYLYFFLFQFINVDLQSKNLESNYLFNITLDLDKPVDAGKASYGTIISYDGNDPVIMADKLTTLDKRVTVITSSWTQEKDSSNVPMSSVDIAYLYISKTIIAAAKQMPEKYYSYRPRSEVRNFRELMIHIAQSNFEMTAIAKGEAVPVLKAAFSKVEVINLLEASFEYSTNARDHMTKQQKLSIVNFNGGSQLAGNVLDFSIFHSLQHYGNVIVYMRLKGLVPPSSQTETNRNSGPAKQ